MHASLTYMKGAIRMQGSLRLHPMANCATCRLQPTLSFACAACAVCMMQGQEEGPQEPGPPRRAANSVTTSGPTKSKGAGPSHAHNPTDVVRHQSSGLSLQGYTPMSYSPAGDSTTPPSWDAEWAGAGMGDMQGPGVILPEATRPPRVPPTSKPPPASPAAPHPPPGLSAQQRRELAAASKYISAVLEDVTVLQV